MDQIVLHGILAMEMTLIRKHYAKEVSKYAGLDHAIEKLKKQYKGSLSKIPPAEATKIDRSAKRAIESALSLLFKNQSAEVGFLALEIFIVSLAKEYVSKSKVTSASIECWSVTSDVWDIVEEILGPKVRKFDKSESVALAEAQKLRGHFEKIGCFVSEEPAAVSVKSRIGEPITASRSKLNQLNVGLITTESGHVQISWSPSLQTGISTIDDARKRLIEIINLANDPEVFKEARDFSPKLVENIKDVFKNYFNAEEELMFKIDYAAVDKHLQSHSVLLSSFDMAMLHLQETGSADRIADFVSEIFVSHLTSDDTSLSLHIQKRRRDLAAIDANKKSVDGIKKRIMNKR
ncbi:MAG: hemerythrin domain-containing protein [Rhodospirillaceae bacterium]